MSRTTPPLVIDARPRGPSGPLAGESVLGRPVLDHLFELAELVDDRVIAIHAREDEHERLGGLLSRRPSARFRLVLGAPPEGAAVLRSDRFYDPARLRRVLRRGGDPESAVIWRIDRPQGLAGAGDEITRRRTYQPLGRFWAARPALALARRLAPTHVRPNMVTLTSAGLMFGGAAVVAAGGTSWAARLVTASAFALALVLDTADGHLARLQGTASAFGRWLDSTLDEVGDMAVHAATAYAAFTQTGRPSWLLLGMAYAIGKYLFVVGSTPVGGLDVPREIISASRPSRLRSVAHIAGHADLRWHLWIGFAAIGRLDAALVIYTAYFFARTLGGAIGKVVAHAA